MALEILGSPIIDDARKIIDVDQIGIKTISPIAQLHVVGDGFFTGTITVPNIVGTITTATNVIGGIGSITNLTVTSSADVSSISGTTLSYSIGKFTSLNSNIGIITSLSGTSLNYLGIVTTGSLSIGSTQVISSSLQLQNISSLDSITRSTIENAIVTSPNTFSDLSVTGLSTFTNGPVLIGSGTSTGIESQKLQVTGDTYITGNLGIGTIFTVDPDDTSDYIFSVSSPIGVSYLEVTKDPYVNLVPYSGNVGIGLTNPTSKLSVSGDASVTGTIIATTFIGQVNSGVATITTLDNSNINSSGIITATQFSTGNSGSAINITPNSITGPSTIIIDPSVVGDDTGVVRIKGDLYVDGTQTIINSSTLEVVDYQISIASTVTDNIILDGAGIGIGSGGVTKTITWDNSASALTSSEDWNLASGKQYEINNISVLSSTTLGTGVTNSSLTSVGTLNQLIVSGISTFTNAPILVGSGTSTGTDLQRLQVTGGAYISGDVGIGTTNPQYKLHVIGSFGATTKSFVINHPTKPGKKLQYGSLESPYHGIRLTGKGKIENSKCIVKLPEYISSFVKGDEINIQVTNIKHGKVLWVEEIDITNNKFIVKTEESVGSYEFYWDFTAIRTDVDDLQVEI